MKTNLLFAGLLMASFVSTSNAQIENSAITSRGLQSGTAGSYVTFYGYRAGNANTGSGTTNTFIGAEAGAKNTTGVGNTFLGFRAASNSLTGNSNTVIGSNAALNGVYQSNTIIGVNAGYYGVNGSGNILIGTSAAQSIGSGGQNVFIGDYGGNSGSRNVFLGYQGGASSNGSNNTFIGYVTGAQAVGSNNIFIGPNAGYGAQVDNQLYIENSSSTTPLIWGDFDKNLVKLNGKVGVGNVTAFPQYSGDVNVSQYSLFALGGILTEAVRIQLKADWADYVFDKEYKLASLGEVERFILANGHLPNMPSAKEVKQNGLELGEMAKMQQEKIEELTLYSISQQKQLEKQEALLLQMEQLLAKQQSEIEALKKSAVTAGN